MLGIGASSEAYNSFVIDEIENLKETSKKADALTKVVSNGELLHLLYSGVYCTSFER